MSAIISGRATAGQVPGNLATVLSLIKSIEAISACRDRARLPGVLLRSVSCLLGERADVGVFSRDAGGEFSLRLFAGPTIMSSVETLWPELLKTVCADEQLVSCTLGERRCGAVMLHQSEIGVDPLFLVYDEEAAAPDGHAQQVATLARIYGNQIDLLDYSELDSLTRLLNRKTFDETFDRLLTPPADDAQEDGVDDRRNHLDEESPAWLCVIDIDHFKRINDSFGHLFGDEVLLRMGDLLRKTFRGGDRLFRFGGEEFVVILNAADEKQAAISFNRLRLSVMNHEFPQVGKVTCSVGFTAVSTVDVPTDAIGRADEALYYAKEHGRNRVCAYERLVAEGLIVKPVEAQATADFDIDALFS